MTKIEIILQELHDGTPLNQIKSKYRSQSQLYEAFRTFLPEAERKIQEVRDELISLGAQRTNIEEHVSSLKMEVSELEKKMSKEKEAHKAWIDDAEEHKNQLQRELVGLGGSIREQCCELNEINSKLTELAKKGVTPEIVTRVYGIELESGEDLLERVKTVTDYINVKKKLEEINDQKTSYEKEIDSLERKKDLLISDIQTEKNRLDESKLKTQTFKEAVAITVHFFTNGYDTADLKSLKDGLDLLGVKGDPKLSITRLIKGLEGIKTLVNLEYAIKECEEELQTLNKNISKAKGELAAIRDVSLKNIDEVKGFAISEIKSLGKDIAKGIKENAENSITIADKAWKNMIDKFENTCKTSTSEIMNFKGNAETTLKDLEQKTKASLNETSKAATSIVQILDTETEKIAKKIDEHIEKTLSMFNEQVSTTMMQFKEDFIKWGELREKSGELKKDIENAAVFFGMLESTEVLKELTPEFVAKHQWIVTMIPSRRIEPSERIIRKEFHLSYGEYRMAVISEWLCEEMEKIGRELLNDF